MAYPIQDKLVIALASSALFDLKESDEVFRTKGDDEYRKFQREHEKDTLKPGVAFPFIKRLLGLNNTEYSPVEVVLFSRNDPDTGLRVFASIKTHELDITRAAFIAGQPPYKYSDAFNVCLFLSANESDVKEATMAGFPAGLVLETKYQDDPSDKELRIAFDFDCVLIDDAPEKVFKTGGLAQFFASESSNASEPHSPGPLQKLFARLSEIQKREKAKKQADKDYKPRIRVAIITARNAPAHERMVTTLRSWGITVDEMFMLGGIEKQNILKVFAPHIFFDDQRIHLDASSGIVPCVHIPFGVRNQPAEVETVVSAS